jgi:hypothetical protein
MSYQNFNEMTTIEACIPMAEIMARKVTQKYNDSHKRKVEYDDVLGTALLALCSAEECAKHADSFSAYMWVAMRSKVTDYLCWQNKGTDCTSLDELVCDGWEPDPYDEDGYQWVEIDECFQTFCKSRRVRREKQILPLLARGLEAKIIAQMLDMLPSNVSEIRSRMRVQYKKESISCL